MQLRQYSWLIPALESSEFLKCTYFRPSSSVCKDLKPRREKPLDNENSTMDQHQKTGGGPKEILNKAGTLLQMAAHGVKQYRLIFP